MYASAAHRRATTAEQFALALAEARTIAHPDDGAAVDDLTRRLGDAGFKDWAIEVSVLASERAKESPTRWRALLAASIAFVDRLDVVPGARLREPRAHRVRGARETASRGACPSWEQIRMKLYQQHLDAGVKSGIDPRRRTRRGFRKAGESALRRSTSAAATIEQRERRRSALRQRHAGSAARACSATAPRYDLHMRHARRRSSRSLAVACGGTAPANAARAADREGHRRALEPRDRADRGRRATEVGTGFILDAAGLIATNLHVVAGESTIKVKLYKDRHEYPVDADRRRRPRPRSRAAADQADAGSCRRCSSATASAVSAGDQIVAIGNPLGMFDYSVQRRPDLAGPASCSRGRCTILQISRADLAGLERRPAVQPVRRGRSA